MLVLLLSPLLLTGPRPSPQVGNGHLLCNPEPNLSSHILVHRHVYHQFREQEMPVPFRVSMARLDKILCQTNIIYQVLALRFHSLSFCGGIWSLSDPGERNP